MQKKVLEKLKMVSYVFALMFIVSACSSGGGGDSKETSVVGKIVDGPIENLQYSCSSGKTAKTNSDGEYSCNAGDDVTFILGKYKFVTLPASDKTLSAYDLFANNSIAAVNFASLVQTLNKNSSNDVILLDDALLEKLPDSINFNDINFSTDMAGKLGKTLVGASTAKENMDTYLTSIGANIPEAFNGNAQDIVAVTLDTNITKNITTPLTIVADGEVVSLSNAAETVAVAMEDNTSVIISAVNNINEPMLVGRRIADSNQTELTYESTAELFTLRTRYFYALKISNQSELSKRIRSHAKFAELVAELKQKIEEGSPCPLDHRCSYYASTIANTIAQDINTTDLVDGGN